MTVRPGRRIESTSEARKPRFQLTSVVLVSSIRDVAWLHNVDERVEEAQQRLSLSLPGLQGGVHRPFRLDVVVRSVFNGLATGLGIIYSMGIVGSRAVGLAVKFNAGF